MKIILVTDIEQHDSFRFRKEPDSIILGVDLQKVIIEATDKWNGLSVGSISIGFSPTLDKFVALKD